MNIVIADDHTLVRAGLRALLERNPQIKVIGEAADGTEAVLLAFKLRPDVLVLDISMPKLNGFETIAQLREQDVPVPVVILSMHSEKVIVRQALERGARGYVLKSAVENELVQAIDVVAKGGTYLCSGVASIVLDDYLSQRPIMTNPINELTARERHLLQLIAEGCTNREAAQILNVAERTIEKHRANLMEKLDVNGVAGLVKLAIQYGLVTLDN